jgi:hypothetical protein
VTTRPVTASRAGGLTLAQLRSTSPRPERLAVALATEVEAGRVRCEDGIYTVVLEAFEPASLSWRRSSGSWRCR